MEENTGSAASLRSFFERCPEMLFIAAVDGKLLQWSDVVRRTLGPAVERGTSIAALAHPEDRAAVDAAWARLQQGAELVQFEARLVDERGAYRCLSCNARRSAEGDAIYGSLRLSSSETKALSEKALLKEQMLDSLAATLPVCLWAIDREGTFILHDGAGLERAGLKPNQFLGMSLLDIYAESESLEDVKRAMAGEAIHALDKQHDVYWETWMVPLGDSHKELASVIGFTLDVSKAKLAEDELRTKLEQIEKQQEVIRNLSTPIIEVWNGVLTLPMVGVVDSVRTAEVMDSLLSRIVEKQARFAILDLTGVEVVDTRVAGHLIQLVTAIKLLGAEGIVAGIKPNVAQTMVALGLDLSQIITQRNLRAALSYCIRRMNAPSQQLAPANGAG